MSKDKGTQVPQSPEQPPGLPDRAIDNGTVLDGGSVVSSSSLAVAVQSPEVISPEVQTYLDAKAREINVVRATLYVRIGGVLAEVKLYCKEHGVKWTAFLARPDVSISEDSAERCLNLFKSFGKVPEADLLSGKGSFSKMYALRAIEEPEVRQAVLQDPSIRRDIENATANEITAAVANYKEKLGSKDRSIEGFREQLAAVTKAHKEELNKIKTEESKTVKVLSAEIERLKGEVATAAKMQSKADVDAVAQFRAQRDEAAAQLRVLAEQYDTMSKRAAKAEAGLDNVVTDKKLREEKRELEAELKDKAKALRDAESKIAELQAEKSEHVEIAGVDMPACTLQDALAFISEQGILNEFVEWLAEATEGSGKKAA